MSNTDVTVALHADANHAAAAVRQAMDHLSSSLADLVDEYERLRALKTEYRRRRGNRR